MAGLLASLGRFGRRPAARVQLAGALLEMLLANLTVVLQTAALYGGAVDVGLSAEGADHEHNLNDQMRAEVTDEASVDCAEHDSGCRGCEPGTRQRLATCERYRRLSQSCGGGGVAKSRRRAWSPHDHRPSALRRQ